MSTDSAYIMGQSHETCQDYARSGHVALGAGQYALVCDGCSSSADSDIGARMLALEASKLAHRAVPSKPLSTAAAVDLGLRAAIPASTRVRDLGLPAESLDATLLMICSDEKQVRFVGFGDGLLLLVQANGRIRYTSISYASGYPYYLTYALEPQRELQFMDKGKDCQTLLGDIWSATSDTDATYNMCTKPATDPHVYTIETANGYDGSFVLAAALSDGMDSFTRETDNGVEAVPLSEVLQLLCQFKTYTGRFVQRRLNRFLRDAKKLGWHHADDLSMAAIYLED